MLLLMNDDVAETPINFIFGATVSLVNDVTSNFEGLFCEKICSPIMENESEAENKNTNIKT